MVYELAWANHWAEEGCAGHSHEDNRVVYHVTYGKVREENVLIPEPALLRTCSEIRDEAEESFYGGPTFDVLFVVLEGQFVVDWLRSLGRRLGMLRHISLHFHAVAGGEIKAKKVFKHILPRIPASCTLTTRGNHAQVSVFEWIRAMCQVMEQLNVEPEAMKAVCGYLDYAKRYAEPDEPIRPSLAHADYTGPEVSADAIPVIRVLFDSIVEKRRGLGRMILDCDCDSGTLEYANKLCCRRCRESRKYDPDLIPDNDEFQEDYAIDHHPWGFLKILALNRRY